MYILWANFSTHWKDIKTMSKILDHLIDVELYLLINLRFLTCAKIQPMIEIEHISKSNFTTV